MMNSLLVEALKVVEREELRTALHAHLAKFDEYALLDMAAELRLIACIFEEQAMNNLDYSAFSKAIGGK